MLFPGPPIIANLPRSQTTCASDAFGLKILITSISFSKYPYPQGQLWAADQKYLESFKMWCWRRMEKISWTDHVRNEEVLLRVKQQRNFA
jgi:hypothetical protein